MHSCPFIVLNHKVLLILVVSVPAVLRIVPIILLPSPSGSQDGTVHIWVVEGKRESNGQSESGSRVSHVTSLLGHQAPIITLAFSESAALLASGCKAGSVRIWDIQVGHQAPIITLAFSESAALLASGCKAGSVRIWDIQVAISLEMHEGSVMERHVV